MPGEELTPRARPRTVFLSALEPSADFHAAALIAAVRRHRPETRFVGLAGPQMQAAGCEALFDFTGRSAMLLGVVRVAGLALDLLRRIDRMFAAGVADLFVPVDSPTFNLPLARRAKARGLPVVYYIAPQVWAWAEFRVHKVRSRTDRLAVILPFEEDYFRSHGIDAKYVGHPLIESLSRQVVDTGEVAALRSLGSPVVTCLPGSRRHVVDEILPGQVEVCRRIASRHPRAVFLFAAASDELARKLTLFVEGMRGANVAFPYRVELGRNPELITAADLVLVASGTATLEVAWHRRPMIVMYNASKWGYRLIARRLIRTEHLSLVNILAGRELVPEFMPYYDSPDPIAAEALALLADTNRRERIRQDLDELIRCLGTHRAADETASIILDTLDRSVSRRARSADDTGPRGSRHRVW